MDPYPEIPKLFVQAVTEVGGNVRKAWTTPHPQLENFTPQEMWATEGVLMRAAHQQQVIRAILNR